MSKIMLLRKKIQFWGTNSSPFDARVEVFFSYPFIFNCLFGIILFLIVWCHWLFFCHQF